MYAPPPPTIYSAIESKYHGLLLGKGSFSCPIINEILRMLTNERTIIFPSFADEMF